MKRFLIVILLSGIIIATGCLPTPENTEIVVSDAITSNGDVTEPEIAPNATVYQIAQKDKQSLVKYLLAKKLEGMEVRFYARPFGTGDDAWIPLGNGAALTDTNGRASLSEIRQWLNNDILKSAPVDLQLRADVVFKDGQTVSDNLGIVRVLSSPNTPFIYNPSKQYIGLYDTAKVYSSPQGILWLPFAALAAISCQEAAQALSTEGFWEGQIQSLGNHACGGILTLKFRTGNYLNFLAIYGEEITPGENPPVLFADHDNTLHATGGQNTLADWINFLNWARNDWPLVDEFVVPSIQELRNAGKDVVIVSGLPTDIRALCRQQVNRHFENNGQRGILLIIKGDLTYEHGNEFKAGALAILKQLYGAGKGIAMVGDTAREDGYGAYANRLFYIPFAVDFQLQPTLLDTEGYGFIDPAWIAWDWSQVMEKIAQGDTVTNFFLRNENGFLNIAHRGNSAFLPENTIEAYRNAFVVGADALEGDVHATSDGYVVISHDDTVDRCTNGSGNIKDMTLAQVNLLDAGYKFTLDGGATYPYRGLGLTLPTLTEVFSDAVLNQAPMVVEFKQVAPSIVDGVLDLIQAYGMEDRVIVESFDKVPMDEIRAEAKLRGINLITSFTQGEIITFFLTPLPVMLAMGYTPPGQVLQVPPEYDVKGLTVKLINNDFLKKARYLGIKVQVWTIDDPIEMRQFKNDKEVDAIMTDDPALLESVINE